MSDYTDKFLNPKWQKRRLKIFERDKFTCQRCGDTKKTLHVHHEYYLPDTEPWDYPDEAFKTLCVDCHTIEKWFQDALVSSFTTCSTKLDDFKLYHRKVFITKFFHYFNKDVPDDYDLEKHYEIVFDKLLKYLDFELKDLRNG